MVNTVKEKDIQLAICNYLAFKRYFFWRQNTIPVVKPDGSFRSMPKYSKTGVPDIILVINGKFMGLEVKTPKGKQSDNQFEFQMGLERAGGQYYLVTSLDDVIKLGL